MTRRFRGYAWYATLSTALALATGCGDGYTDPGLLDDVYANTGESHEPLYYLSTALWPFREIGVCWAPGQGYNPTPSEKELIRGTLKGQRSWEAAGNISFVGWGDCPSPVPGIQIVPTTTLMGVSHVGYRPGSTLNLSLDFQNPQNEYLRCTAHGLGRTECIRTEAIHEFGHALGYAHEHNRPEVSCGAAPQGENGNATFGPWDGQGIMNYCNWPMQISGLERDGTSRLYGQRYGDAPRMRDYNGDGRADWLCHNTTQGQKDIDYADAWGQFWGWDWRNGSNWCGHNEGKLYKGRFNSDTKFDLLCHDRVSGFKWIDYADANGQFNGTDWFRDAQWCESVRDRLHVGDFNGDNRSDMLCHNSLTGRRSIDFADVNGQFWGTDWESPADTWCQGNLGRIHVGKFNDDQRDDLLCHALEGGIFIDYASPSGELSGTDWSILTAWCTWPGEELFIGDFDGNIRDDLLCHSTTSGAKWIDYVADGQFWGTDWSRDAQWCAHSGARLYIGKFNNDSRDDLLCHDVRTGFKWIDYSDTASQFWGTDWSRDANWSCNTGATDGHELH